MDARRRSIVSGCSRLNAHVLKERKMLSVVTFLLVRVTEPIAALRAKRCGTAGRTVAAIMEDELGCELTISLGFEHSETHILTTASFDVLIIFFRTILVKLY
jgi:hypothetical protein